MRKREARGNNGGGIEVSMGVSGANWRGAGGGGQLL